jgi:hypothetical protein
MKKTIYEDLQHYWQTNKLPPDGGISETFNEARIGSFSFRYPNFDGRALLLHDINHLLTGYPTNWVGECQVSAWELASGGRKGYPRTWIYPVSLVMLGLLICPVKTHKAFLAGKGKTNPFILSATVNVLELSREELERLVG